MKTAARGKRYGFVLPRFAEGIAGGAETLTGSLARRLAARGDDVMVLTTCAKDNRTWENFFPAGESIENGLEVIRFRVDERDLDAWVPLQIAISDGMQLSVPDQMRWMEESVNSTTLYRYLAARARSYDALFFAPYLFGTTFWGSQIAPERSCLIPCLHNERYAYLDIIGSMFRQVRGCLFNASAEADLARSLYGPIAGGEVGMGFEPISRAELARLTPFFSDKFPYLLYVGRKETGKGVQDLIDSFLAAKQRGMLGEDLRLVIAGGGSFEDLHRPEARTRSDIVDVDHVSEDDKRRLIRHAAALCQPSVNESFSIVLMEAWLLGTPVLVNGRCIVTREHVIASGGGLYFTSPEELGGTLRELLASPDLRGTLARAGERYVRERYSWDKVLERFDRVVATIFATGNMYSRYGA